MPTFHEYRVLPVADRLSRLRRTPGELDEAIADRDDGELGRRPDARNWSAKEIICHLRDVEELFQVRFTRSSRSTSRASSSSGPRRRSRAVADRGLDSPSADPDRWVEERQYVRNDARLALAAFRQRRAEVLTLLESLSVSEWQRGGIHLGRGRLTLGDWVVSLAGHDDNHLDQFHRALAGRP